MLSQRFLDTPAGGVDWVVTVSVFILLELICYFVVVLGDEMFSLFLQ